MRKQKAKTKWRLNLKSFCFSKRSAARRLLRSFAVAAAIVPPPASAQQQQQQPTEWAKMPRMLLERQFAGPLQDTIVQRWRDPADGSVCYIYLPITAAHSAPTTAGFVQYGANSIGSITCFASPPPSSAAKR